MQAKRLIISLLLAFFCTHSTYTALQWPKKNKPLLVVLLMVRDEKDVIVPTLETYLSQDIKDGKPDNGEVAYVIYDTGSVDETEKIAEEFLREKGLKHILVVKDTWINFEKSRNKALALARSKFPESTFILFPDAEWYLQNFDDLVTFCKQEIARQDTGEQLPCYYRLKITRPGFQGHQQRLFLTHDDVQFEGAVHEVPNKCVDANVPNNVYFELGWSKSGSDKTIKRWSRDREILLNDLLENPSHVRSAHYLALTELWLCNYRNAYTYFKMRTNMHSFPEEDFQAQYYLGVVTDILSTNEPESFTWEEALKYYLHAFSMRPHRAEPLIRIAMHYLNENNHALSYVFAKRAAELPFPEQDMLPLEKALYEFDRYELLSRAAWYVQEYEVGEKAAKKAIEARPNSPYLYKNLSYYWELNK